MYYSESQSIRRDRAVRQTERERASAFRQAAGQAACNDASESAIKSDPHRCGALPHLQRARDSLGPLRVGTKRLPQLAVGAALARVDCVGRAVSGGAEGTVREVCAGSS